MNIGYVIFCESLFEPILKTQVLNLLKKMAEQKNGKLYIYWFCPIKSYFVSNKEIEKLTKELTDFNIELKTIPILFLGRWFNVSLPKVPLVYQIMIPLIYYMKKNKIDLFHIRSYPGAIPFVFLKRVFKRINFVLDTRSDFVNENILNNWKNKRLTIGYWRKKEKKLYEIADKIIAISEEFSEQKLKDFKMKTEVIPNNVHIENYKRNLEFRDEFRRKKKLENKIVFCYLGSLGNGWNKVETYINFFKLNKRLRSNYHFLILTPNKDEIESELTNNHILEGNYTVESVPNSEVGKYLSVADFGLQIMGHEDSRIGIKVVEYLTAGLPVIVNDNVKGAASIIKNNSLGTVIDNGILSERDLKNMIENYQEYSNRCKHYAEITFSTAVIAEKYLMVYKSLLEKLNFNIISKVKKLEEKGEG